MVGMFSTNMSIKLTSCKLPCLSKIQTFNLTVVGMPKSSNNSNYDIILGQTSMKYLNLDTSYFTKTIFWGKKEVPIVSRSYWMPEWIQQQKEWFIHTINKLTTDETKITSDTPMQIVVSHTTKLKHIRQEINMTNTMKAAGRLRWKCWWHVGMVSVTCQSTPILLAENQPTLNVANIVTGFVTGSYVGWHISAQLPSHIHNSIGNYSDGGNNHLSRKQGHLCIN